MHQRGRSAQQCIARHERAAKIEEHFCPNKNPKAGLPPKAGYSLSAQVVVHAVAVMALYTSKKKTSFA